MKNIFKKNQVVISVLAVMIAVAGYLRFSSGIDDVKTDEDAIRAANEKLINSETSEDYQDLAVNDVDADIDEIDMLEPGSAVLTSSVSGFASGVKLEREQTRAKNKETLLEIINNENITDQQKQAAVDQMVQMTEITEKENSAELMLTAQGFKEVVVSMNDGQVDVTLDMTGLGDADRAQIEDIVKRKTGVTADKITISPINTEAGSETAAQETESAAGEISTE